MNSLQLVSAFLSPICLVITTVLAWVVIYRKQRTEVSFTGEPVDKKDFEKAEAAHAAVHAQLFAKIGGAERGVENRMGERMARIETNTDKIWEKMESDKTEILKTGEDRATKTHDRINAVLEAVAELRGQVNAKK